VQNNSVYDTANYRGGINLGGNGSGYIVENNAIWTNNTSCFAIAAPTLRNANNFCRSSGGPGLATIWVDALNSNFKPVPSGPLVGAANQSHYAATAIGSVPWSSTDTGVARVSPIDIGAYQR
jgi:hypothetical protein